MIHSCTVLKHQLPGQVCFHRRLFSNPVKQHWCIKEPVGSLGSTKQNWLGAKLLPMAISIYPVVYVHPYCLLGAQHHCLWQNGRENPPSACPPTPTTPTSLPPIHPLISDTHDITGVVKIYLKNYVVVNTAQQSYL